ncbi:MAG: HAMP domain-containing protein, partial [Alphaproteobacteria bacterium]|nr:HAMP domain-containing protein [Alphaproteobacteria bacterium]
AVQTSRKVADQTVFVEVVQNLQHPDVIFDDVIADFLRRMAVFMVPALLLLAILDALAVGRVLKPVSRLSRDAAAIGPGQLDLRLSARGVPTEVQPLIRSFNDALDRLERAFHLQRDFVQVIDEGPGVAENERDLIFRRFWRRSRAQAGSVGIGLAIVARVAEAHGSSITVTENARRGATFTLDLTGWAVPRGHAMDAPNPTGRVSFV